MKRFDAYEISGFQKDNDNSHAVFWSLNGHIKGKGVQCIGDFDSANLAMKVYSLIVGEDAHRFPVTIN